VSSEIDEGKTKRWLIGWKFTYDFDNELNDVE
jgi:hypothetical protein